jgi:hypothetical protein
MRDLPSWERSFLFVIPTFIVGDLPSWERSFLFVIPTFIVGDLQSWERSFFIVIPHPDAGSPVVGTQSDDRFSLNQKHNRLFGYHVHKGQIPH